MGRHRRNRHGDDLVDVVATFPWWVGVLLALFSYLLLSAVASQPIRSPTPGSSATQNAVPAVLKGVASAAQYFVPLLCLAGAGVSAIRRRKRQQLVTSAAGSTDLIDGMSWQEFEMLVSEAFRQQGYQVSERGGGGADGGVDLVLIRAQHGRHERTLVQCKHWRAYKVGVGVVRELYGVMAAEGAVAGIVVTSGRFTTEARSFAQGRHLRLIDGSILAGWIGSARARLSCTPSPEKDDTARLAVKAPAVAPTCPKCGGAMVERTARRGGQAGSRLWGCATYPACRGTRSIEPH